MWPSRPSRVSPLLLHTQAESGALLWFLRFPRRRPSLTTVNHQRASPGGQSGLTIYRRYQWGRNHSQILYCIRCCCQYPGTTWSAGLDREISEEYLQKKRGKNDRKKEQNLYCRVKRRAGNLYCSRIKIHRFSVCDSNIWIGVNPRVVVAPFARRHLWCICAAISVGSQCVVARFARRHLWGICGAVSVGSQCVVARFARGHLW